MPDGVIFDVDGVLVASGPAHAASWQALGRRHGLEITKEEFRKTFGQSSRDIIRRFWGEGLSDEQIRELDEEKERIYREWISGMVPLTIGAREVLDALHGAGFVLAIGTSGPPENVELVLSETGIGRYFATTVNGFDVSSGKPAPDIYLLAAERAGLRPKRCVVVEDAPAGIQSGRAARMGVIGLVGTHPADVLRKAGANRVVGTLREITPVVVRAVLNDAT
jgi:beta-phosphoglucomutase